MRFAAALAAAGVSLISLAAAVSLGPGHETLAQPATTTVQVGDYYFCDPSYVNGVCETTVNEGDIVEWQFSGIDLHSTTECSDGLGTCSAPHLWNSEFMTTGSFSFTFDTPGTYLYRCQLHPFQMRGQINVLAAAQPSPTPTPQASPQAPPAAATPTPAAQASAVPSGGGAPPADGGAALWWIAAAVGGMLIGSAALLAARGFRRRDV